MNPTDDIAGESHHESHRSAETALRECESRLAKATALAQLRGEQLLEMEEQLRQTATRERDELGRVLHDHLQQLLAAAKLRLSMVRRSRSNEGDASSDDLKEVDKLLVEAIQATRELSAKLKNN